LIRAWQTFSTVELVRALKILCLCAALVGCDDEVGLFSLDGGGVDARAERGELDASDTGASGASGVGGQAGASGASGGGGADGGGGAATGGAAGGPSDAAPD